MDLFMSIIIAVLMIALAVSALNAALALLPFAVSSLLEAAEMVRKMTGRRRE